MSDLRYTEGPFKVLHKVLLIIISIIVQSSIVPFSVCFRPHILNFIQFLRFINTISE